MLKYRKVFGSRMPFTDKEVWAMLLKSLMDYEGEVCEETLSKHLRTPPKDTVIRINTLITDKSGLKDEMHKALSEQYLTKETAHPIIEFHQKIEDVLIVKSSNTARPVEAKYPQVIVGLQCGVAVLRGSAVYAPGVTAIPTGLSNGDKVSVFADLTGQCKRGWNTTYEGPTYFVGNGCLVQNRHQIFSTAEPRGLAVNMFEPLFDCPSIGDILLEDSKTGFQKGFLQNLPSVICGHALNPQQEHLVLDLCAAPGGKTTHIACLMENKGLVIALDKSKAKILQVRENAKKLGLNNISAFPFDSTKACADDSQDGSTIPLTPPFSPNTFDRILLDAPCSALGQRPQLHNPIRLKEVNSFARLQKKLFLTAVTLLKPGGRMVYSTCTYNVAENEEIIDWGLAKFPCLRVVSSGISVGRPGYTVGRLNKDECELMQRFGSPCDRDGGLDTIGFFICCLEKRM